MVLVIVSFVKSSTFEHDTGRVIDPRTFKSTLRADNICLSFLVGTLDFNKAFTLTAPILVKWHVSMLSYSCGKPWGRNFK